MLKDLGVDLVRGDETFEQRGHSTVLRDVAVFYESWAFRLGSESRNERGGVILAAGSRSYERRW